MQWPPKFWQAPSKFWQKPQTDEAFRSVAPIIAAIGGLMLWHSLQPSSLPGPARSASPRSAQSLTQSPTQSPTVTAVAKATMTPAAKAAKAPVRTASPQPTLNPPPPTERPQSQPSQISAPIATQTPPKALDPLGQPHGSWAFGWLLLLGMGGEIALLAWLYGLLQQSRTQRRRAELAAEPLERRSGVSASGNASGNAGNASDSAGGNASRSSQSARLDPGLADLRTRLVTTISHEYRTPLTTILTTTELLERYGSKISEANKRRYTQRIRQSVQEMTDRLDAVLLLHQGTLGQLRCQPQPVDVWQLCQDWLEAARLGASGHSFFLNDQLLPPSPVARMARSDAAVAVGDRLPAQVQIDPQLARSALSNLLTNAVQFSPQGGRIQLAVMYQDLQSADLAPELREAPGEPPIARSGFVIFQLRDEGIGIAAADQAHLGAPFYRGSNVGAIRGAGLGLAIAQQCIAAHGGSLQLISELGQGTTVQVTLPIG
jgi:signal transduction histidine kinase